MRNLVLGRSVMAALWMSSMVLAADAVGSNSAIERSSQTKQDQSGDILNLKSGWNVYMDPEWRMEITVPGGVIRGVPGVPSDALRIRRNESSLRIQNYLPPDDEGIALQPGQFFIELNRHGPGTNLSLTDSCLDKANTWRLGQDGFWCRYNPDFLEGDATITHIGMVATATAIYSFQLDGSQLTDNQIVRIVESIKTLRR